MLVNTNETRLIDNVLAVVFFYDSCQITHVDRQCSMMDCFDF